MVSLLSTAFVHFWVNEWLPFLNYVGKKKKKEKQTRESFIPITLKSSQQGETFQTVIFSANCRFLFPTLVTISRLLCIIHAIISYFFWNICSCPRSDTRYGWYRMIVSKALATLTSSHAQKEQLPVAPHWQSCSAKVKLLHTTSWWLYIRPLDIKDCAGVATKEKIWLSHVGDRYRWRAELSFVPSSPSSPSNRMQAGLGFSLIPRNSFLGWQDSGLPALLRSLEPVLAVTHRVCKQQFSPWPCSARG